MIFWLVCLLLPALSTGLTCSCNDKKICPDQICETDGTCLMAVVRLKTGEIKESLRCIHKKHMIPSFHPIICQYNQKRKHEHIRACCKDKDFCNLSLNLTLGGVVDLLKSKDIPSSDISNQDTHYDSFVLAQHWPLTSCMDWKESSTDNSCKIPGNATWSVRGLLQSLDGKVTSSSCISKVTFVPSLLDPIKEELHKYWPDFLVDKSNNCTWEREWRNHGSCKNDPMDSPVQYFSKGCHLGKTHPIESWLASENLHPGNSYSLAKIQEALALQSNSSHVVCQRIQGRHYLAEIKTCFSKNLTETSCDGVIKIPEHSEYLGSCPRHGLIRYPDKVDLMMFKPTTKRTVALQLPISQISPYKNCKPGQTFNGTPRQAKNCLRKLRRQKEMEARIAKIKKVFKAWDPRKKAIITTV